MIISLMEMDPEIIPALDGSWLAVVPDGAPINVGAQGSTPEDAQYRFQMALELVLRALNDPAMADT